MMDHLYNRQMPAIDTTLLGQSSAEAKNLMHDTNLVIDALENKEFATRLMTAAQDSDYREVYRLLYSLGLKSRIQIHFNPDGIRIEFQPQSETLNICNFSLSLRWR